MDLRVVLLCIVAAYGQSPDYERNYKSEIRSSSDLRGENTNSVPGFVQPLDFNSFTQQFFAGSQSVLAAPFAFGSPEVFGAESKKTGVFQTANSDFVPFSGSPFPEDVKTNNTGFVQPVHFVSPFERDGSNTKIYHHQKPPNTSLKKYPQQRDPMHKAATVNEEDEEGPYAKHTPSPSRQNYKQSPKLASLKRDHFGKSSYNSPQKAHKSEHSPSADSAYYLPKHKDVEVFLPKEKLTVLPMVNGKPKPYDGYRAASEVRNYDSYESDDDDDDDDDDGEDEDRDSSGRYSEGEIIYGKPKPGPHNIVLPYVPGRARIKRSPAEYHGGIYPHYDYSDPKHNKKLEVKEDKQNKLYPKKHQPEVSEKHYDQYKYPKGNKKVNKTKDNYGHATEENPEEYKEIEEQNDEQQEPQQQQQQQQQQEQEQEKIPEQEQEQEEQGEEQEQEQEQEQEEVVEDIPPIKYRYDNEFNIPELKVKLYPYESLLKKSAAAAAAKDSKRASSKDNARSSSNYDEFTADYESYKKTLPSDLEKYFGSPDFEERYTVAATENLEKNKNCQKISKIVTPKEVASGKVKRGVSNNDQQVCYICTDPSTGGSFEQCAYQTDPKSEKFFHGGSSSYKSTEKTEPITYRYRRSPYDDHFSLEHFIFGDEPHAARRAREDHEYVPKPKKVNRKKYKKPPTKNKAKYKYDGSHKKYDPLAKIIGAPSTYADESARVEGPPESYSGPAYTYEGPSRPYEGPKETYEGPASPYEGPAEPYEGPISQEYYDTTDERIEDEYNPPKQEPQSTAPKENAYYKSYQKQSKPRAYSVKHVRPQRGPKSEVEEFKGGNYRVGDGFIADYRFGPEHFEDDEEVEPTRQNEEIKRPKKVKSTEKRGPHKFTQSEEKTPASSEAEEVGHVRVYKNGDVCQKKKKDGMICMVCQNEKTSASYEQCQYSSKPKDKYYTFGSQKSYSSNKAPSDRHERNAESDQYPEKSDIVEKKILIRKESKIFGDDAEPPESLIGAESRGYDHFREFLLSGDLVGAYSENDETTVNQNDTNDEDGSKNTESIERIEPRDEVEGLDEFLYGTPDNDKKATEDEKAEYKSYDDYFTSLFPEFAKNEEKTEGDSDSDTEASFDPFENIREFKVYEPEEPEEISPVDISDSPKNSEASNEEPVRLKDQGSRIPTDFFEPYSEEHKKDLEKALGEFVNKDWSNCKKIVKNKLTCYQCIDKNGISNEECMYVESSQPVSKHLAYHEKKELRPESPASKEEAESQKNEQTVAPTTEKTTTEPNKTNEESYRRIRKPKNSRPEIIEVSEAPQENEENIPTKGDLEGLSRTNVDEITFTTTHAPATYESEPEVTTQRPRIKKNRKNQKKRIKSKKDGNETSTEVIRKKKYPVKKFSDQDREILSDDSSNPNPEESSRVVNEDNGSVVKIFFNNTEGSTR